MNAKNINQEIGTRIRERRIEKELSLGELARKSGVAKGTISKYENPERENQPSFIHIIKLCEVLDVSPEWIYYGPENEDMIHDKLNQDLDLYISRAKSLGIPQKRHILQSLQTVVDFDTLSQMIDESNRNFRKNYPNNLDISI